MRYVKLGLLGLMSLIYIVTGWNHFANPDFFLRMMPPYIPLHEEAVLISGIAEVALGVGLWIPRLRALSAWGIIALLIAVFPANLHMALNDIPADPSGQGGRGWVLWARLPLQVVLILWAWWYTTGRAPADADEVDAGGRAVVSGTAKI